jgi:hypothetical protein
MAFLIVAEQAIQAKDRTQGSNALPLAFIMAFRVVQV